jgi:hypothetical protein
MSYPKNLHEIILIRKGITARKEKDKKKIKDRKASMEGEKKTRHGLSQLRKF